MLAPRHKFWGVLCRTPLAVLRAVRRHPVRSLLLVILLLSTLFGLRTLREYLEFRRHLNAGREATDRWHNYTAIRHLSIARTLRPANPEALLLAARLARRMGEFDESERLLDLYVELHGETEKLVFERLLHRAARGDTDATAAPLLARIRRGGTEARLAWEAQVFGLTIQFRFSEARAVLAEWQTAHPDDPVAMFLDGRLKVEEQGLEQAVAAFRRALELDPELEEARLQLATLLVTRRRSEEAVAELAVLRERLPDHPEVQVLWVRALSLAGRTAEARAALDKCLEQHSDFPGALVERGSFALLDGNEAAAADFLSRAVWREPGNLGARNQLALALSRAGRPAEAAKEYEVIKQLTADSERITALVRGELVSDPNNPAIHREIGMIALRGGDVREALRWFHSALRVNPDHLPTHRTLAALYQEIENPVLAAKHRAIAHRLGAQPGKQ